MSYEDYTLVKQTTVVEPETSVFNALVRKTVGIVHSTGLFKLTGIKIRDTENMLCPAAVVYPLKWDRKQTLNGGTTEVEYSVGIALGIRHPNDCIAMQMALDLSCQLGKVLSRQENRNEINISGAVSPSLNGKYIGALDTTHKAFVVTGDSSPNVNAYIHTLGQMTVVWHIIEMVIIT